MMGVGAPDVNLPLDDRFRVGFITVAPTREAARANAELAERCGYDSIWAGDHIAFPMPILDPLLQLAQIAAFSDHVTLGTSVYLLPLRQPTGVAKQVATLDHLSGGRFIFGVGQGGEFPKEYEACAVPMSERGARMSESIEISKKLWTGKSVSHQGRFTRFTDVEMLPAPVQKGGPPVWCGGRSPAALRRIGRLADGWISYVVTPERYRQGLEVIAAAAEKAGRQPERFGSGHLMFVWVDDDYETALRKATEHLSRRYAMDFSAPAKKYAALGRREDVAASIDAFRRAGLRHLVVDPTGPAAEREAQLERFAREVVPLL